MTTTITRQDCLALPYIATSEDKADQFAAVVEGLYTPYVRTKTFEDGGPWIVVVVEGMEHSDCLRVNDFSRPFTGAGFFVDARTCNRRVAAKLHLNQARQRYFVDLHLTYIDD